MIDWRQLEANHSINNHDRDNIGMIDFSQLIKSDYRAELPLIDRLVKPDNMIINDDSCHQNLTLSLSNHNPTMIDTNDCVQISGMTNRSRDSRSIETRSDHLSMNISSKNDQQFCQSLVSLDLTICNWN